MRVPPRAPSRYVRLAPVFDTAPLQAELDRIVAANWIDHYNTTAYASGWQCIALRSVGGRLDHVMAIDSDAYADTPILASCPHLRQVLAAFECELQSVRLMALAPGAAILPHRDPGTGYEDGVARLHIPVRTAPEVMFHIDGEAVHFAQGGTWYLNANCLHAVENRSTVNRVHLALDCVPNAWLDRLFAQAGYMAPPPPRYGERNITDANVAQVIEALRAGGTPAGLREAERLAALARLEAA